MHHVNPTCGDEVTLRVHLADGSRVEDVSYDALGCSISQASASVMTDLVIGKPVDEAMAIHEEFLTLMQGKGTVEPDEDVLEDGIAFAGVAKFPARVKCALLSWMAWKDATAQATRPAASPRPLEVPDDRDPARPHPRPRATLDHSDLPEVPEAAGSGGAVGTHDRRRRHRGDEGRRRPRARHQRRRPRPGLRRAPRRGHQRRPRHDPDLGGLPADRRDPGPDQPGPRGPGQRRAINWVWMPPWGPDKITDDGREQLRALGFNV